MKKMFFSSTLMWGASLEELFDRAAAEQMGLELFIQQMDFFQYSPQDIRSFKIQNDVPVFVHSYSWDLNLASLNQGIRNESIRQTKKAIDFAKEIGAIEVTVHPGHQTFSGGADAYEGIMHDSLLQLSEYSQWSEMLLSIEIMEKIPKEFVTSSESLLKVMGDLAEKLKTTVDTAHCDSEFEIMNTLYSLPNVSKIHISNRTQTTYHTALPDGYHDFERLFDFFRQFDLPFVIEGFDSSPDHELLNRNFQFLKTKGAAK